MNTDENLPDQEDETKAVKRREPPMPMALLHPCS